MSDYAKKTVAELQEILKSRSLASSGKKADLVARLNEADKEAEVNATVKAPTAEATAPAPTVDEPGTETATTAEAPAESAAPAEPTTTETSDAPTTDAPTASHSLNLPTSEVDSEMAKRKARADRFGTGPQNGEVGAAGTEEKDTEAERALERAQRFGTGMTAMGKLDEALPSELDRRNRKRGRTDETSTMDDAGLRRGFQQRGRGRGRGRGGRRGGDRPTGVEKTASYSDVDRAAADARKKRFAAAS